MTSPHILCIMSHYTDPALSLRRLEISRATLLPLPSSVDATACHTVRIRPPEKK